MENRRVLGLSEDVHIKGDNKGKNIVGRVDTGATKSSIDRKLFNEIHSGNVEHTRIIRQAHGKSERPLVKLTISIKGEEYVDYFTIANRSKMKYKLLIGQNILKQGGFVIDPLIDPLK